MTDIPIFEVEPCFFTVEPTWFEEGPMCFIAKVKEYPNLWAVDENPVIALNLLWIDIRDHLDAVQTRPETDA